MFKYAAVFVVLLAGVCLADGPKSKDEKGAKAEPVYVEKADAPERIREALEIAKDNNQNVLIVWGGNWCSWCLKLDGLFKENKDIASVLRSEYILLPLDMKKNMETMVGYKADPMKGVPFLTILSPAGEVVINQETGSLEDGPKHDPAKVLAFLKKHKPEPLDARKVWKQTLGSARKTNKKVFVRFTAPWCPYCRMMDNFLARKDVRGLLGDDLVVVAIDRDRMKNGAELEKEIRKDINSGIPWFAFYRSDGKLITTSEGKQGNVGFPVAEDEIDFFNGLLKKVIPAPKADAVTDLLKKQTEALRKKSG